MHDAEHHRVEDSAIYQPEHEEFRRQVRRFIEREILPHQHEWEKAGRFDRKVWRKAGDAGLLCADVPEEYGGAGADRLFGIVVIEELAATGATPSGFWLQSEVVAPYILKYGSDAQKHRWLPELASGRVVTGVAMTEPDAGSDLRGIKTFAEKIADGWKLSGQKVFIGNGALGDLFVVAAKTERSRSGKSISLFLVDASLPGFRRGRTLEKIGAKAQDTAELFFDDMLLGNDALLGKVGDGMAQLSSGLVRERLMIAANAQARAEFALRVTSEYVKNRSAFTQKLIEFQNTRFQLAEIKANVTVGRTFIDDVVKRYVRDQLGPSDAAIAKLWVTEMLCKTADTCLQLHGGWGYMWEYPIARIFADTRVERITGGTSEIMKEIVARTL